MGKASQTPLISVTIDERSLAEADRILRAIPGAAQRVMSQSLNRTVSSSRTFLARRLSRRLGARVGDIRRRLFMRKANRNYLRAALDASTHRDQLIDMAARQTERGVTYRPFGGGRQRLIEHAFIATGATRGRQVWLRSRFAIGREKYIEWNDRHMEALYLQKGAPLSSLIEPGDTQALGAHAGDILAKEINQRTGHELARWANK